MARKLKFAGDPKDRAMVAYVKTEGAEATHRITHSYARKYRGLKYVLLTERNKVTAVYRVQNDDSLRRLRRWPKKLNDAIPKIKPKTSDEIVRAMGLKFFNSMAGNEEMADNLMQEWVRGVNELECCEDHAHELSNLTPKEIRDGITAGYLRRPLSIDTIREYKARLGN